jgi:hypothetical protein
VLLVEGDHLIGAKQNRVITSTVLIGAKQRVSLPVVCVEQERWNGPARFEGAATMAPAYLRRLLKTSVTQARFEPGRAGANQQEVWSHIATQQRRLRVASRTRSLEHTFAEHAAEVGDVAAQLPYRPGACGVAARPLSVEEAGPILLALARSLRAIHQAHVLHRDIKLENALLCAGDGGVTLKILDFGISARAREESTAVHHLSLRGTLPYMGPEVVEGRALDARSDVYAFGVCCFRVLTGQFPVPPRGDESDLGYLNRIRALTQVDLSRLPPLPGGVASTLPRDAGSGERPRSTPARGAGPAASLAPGHASSRRSGGGWT